MGHLALLWHLHQPDYRDPATGRPQQPWVRLHTLRGYRDVILDIARDEVPCTVNVVPSMLDQMAHYATGGDDPHLALTVRPADALDPADVAELRATFVCGNPRMIDSAPAYRALAARVRGGDALQVADLRDLQVWSTLAWFGSTARRDFPALDALRAKGARFDEADKQAMLGVQAEILASFPAAFAKLPAAAALSCSPYYHPILPLLVSNAHARRNLPHLTAADDAGFAWPEDALLQLTSTRKRVAQIVGKAPIGLWPSEGSVSPEVVALAAQAGFRWLATDEGVLQRSEREGGGHGGWDLGHGVRGFFRDHELSDRVGFEAAQGIARAQPQALVAEAGRRAGRGALVLALDGENPWEAFPDAGHAFRQGLHRALADGPVRAITLDALAADHPPVGRVRKLHTGSWIGADFTIWYGHPDDRRAWRLLADARRAIDAAPAARREAALAAILPAEGSDWFWWYGPEFDTPFLAAFDANFRQHLRATWRALGQTPPAELDQPLTDRIRGAVDADLQPPTRWISPVLEERPTWARWIGAGELRMRRGSAMAHGRPAVTSVRYGQDRDQRLWIAVLLDGPRPAGEQWRVQVGEQIVEGRVGDVNPVAQFSPHALIVRLPPPDGPARLQIDAHRDEAPVARVPAEGQAVLTLPTPSELARGWLA